MDKLERWLLKKVQITHSFLLLPLYHHLTRPISLINSATQFCKATEFWLACVRNFPFDSATKESRELSHPTMQVIWLWKISSSMSSSDMRKCWSKIGDLLQHITRKCILLPRWQNSAPKSARRDSTAFWQFLLSTVLFPIIRLDQNGRWPSYLNWRLGQIVCLFRYS